MRVYEKPNGNGLYLSVKIAVMGDPSVGKTSLMNCLEGREFNSGELQTVGLCTFTIPIEDVTIPGIQNVRSRRIAS